MNKKIFTGIILIAIFWAERNNAQQESLTSSPYSLYGLGVHNLTQIGALNGMAGSGLAYSSPSELNSLNPASYAEIGENSFLYDLGVKGAFNTYKNKLDGNNTVDFNFSNFAIGLPLKKNLGMGLTLLPYSSVGYTLTGIATNIESSTQTYASVIEGSGGLNNLEVHVGYKPFSFLRVGLNSSFLFGNINESESVEVSGSSFQIVKNSHYKGVRLGLGAQLQMTESLGVGGTLKFPTQLGASTTRDVSKVIQDTEVTIEDNVELDADHFELPWEIGIGLTYSLLNKKLLLNGDYHKKRWASTNQKDKIGTYQDETIYNIGVQYVQKLYSENYLQRIKYRIGYTYDTGYLLINEANVSSQNLTVGFGFPLSGQNNSFMNLSYAYGQRGHIQSQMVKENYHLFTLNFSLENIWFVKHKIE